MEAAAGPRRGHLPGSPLENRTREESLSRAVALRRGSRLHEARREYQALLAEYPDDPVALNGCAQVTAQLGDVDEAILLFERTIARRPDLAGAHSDLAVLLQRRGRFREAEASCRRAIALNPDRAMHHLILGECLDGQGRLAQAAAAYDEAVRRDARLAAAHLRLASVHQRLERLPEAEAAYRRTLELRPRDPVAWFNLGIALQEMERHLESVDAYREAIAAKPGFVEAQLQLGNVLQALGRLDEAIDAYRRLLTTAPDMADAHNNLAKALWARGRLADALAACDACLARSPGNTAALAFKAVLLDEAGAQAAARQLLDFERFLRTSIIEAPPGYPDLAGFNAALVRRVANHPTLVLAPRRHATREAKHTAELAAEQAGPIADLLGVVDRAARRYLAEMPADPDHPFAAHRPTRWRASIWAVVMEGQGYQVPHIHPKAWLSGVYYASVPAQVAEEPGVAGWIEFGEPQPELGCSVRRELKLIRPQEGMMVLFPSYFYHRTVPLLGAGLRVSLAFDLVAQP